MYCIKHYTQLFPLNSSFGGFVYLQSLLEELQQSKIMKWPPQKQEIYFQASVRVFVLTSLPDSVDSISI